MKSSDLNITAYRIYKILHWLRAEPLSGDELNERFLADPMIARRLSEDTLWLYINTLRLVGCEISRPVPTNGYRYELVRHPFGILLSEAETQVLARAKELAEDYFTYQEMLQLDRFLKNILRNASITEPECYIEAIFTRTRSIDYDTYTGTIQTLRQAVQKRQLLFLTYLSPMKGKTRFYFLPEELLYKQGLLYLQGSQLGRDEPVLLRVDRISRFEEAEQPAIYEQLMRIEGLKRRIRLRFPGLSSAAFEPLGMGEEIQDETEGGQRNLVVTLFTRDLFLLKQKLLEGGVPFQVLEPEGFKADMLETLVAMSRLYETRPGEASQKDTGAAAQPGAAAQTMETSK